MESNGDRQTIALVSEKINSLSKLTEVGFLNLQKELDKLSDLPVRVTELQGAKKDLEHRVDKLEKKEEQDAEWKRGPAFMVAAAVLTGVLNLFIAGGLIHFG